MGLDLPPPSQLLPTAVENTLVRRASCAASKFLPSTYNNDDDDECDDDNSYQERTMLITY